MLRLLIDQDLDPVILRACYFAVPTLDVITAHQVGLSNTGMRKASVQAFTFSDRTNMPARN